MKGTLKKPFVGAGALVLAEGDPEGMLTGLHKRDLTHQ